MITWPAAFVIAVFLICLFALLAWISWIVLQPNEGDPPVEPSQNFGPD